MFFALTVAAAMIAAEPGDGLPIKLFPEDSAKGDFFGQDVAIGGFTAIIGAIYDDDNGEDSGGAYLFDIVTGTQLDKLLPEDGQAGDEFGFSTAIHGSMAVVGSWKASPMGAESGAAYIFDITTGEQLHKLVPSDGVPGARFGIAVDIHNGVVIVGAYHDDDFGMWSGSAYLFDAETGEQINKLLPDGGGAPEDIFGRSVAIHAGRALVGAPQTDDNGFSSGSAYVFDVVTGDQISKIVPDDNQQGDQFGYGVDLHGQNAIMSARGDDDAGDGAGAAYIYNIETGEELAKLQPTDAAAGDRFGHSVSITGDLVGVGSYLDDIQGEDSGAAYIFELDGTQISKLFALDGENEDYFGLSIAIAGDRVCVTALRDDEFGVDSGSAYLYGSTCLADINGDGLLNILDFVYFQELFVAGCD